MISLRTPKPLSLVTGAAGFIGSNLVDYLVEQGHQVVCIDNQSANNEIFIGMKTLTMLTVI